LQEGIQKRVIAAAAAIGIIIWATWLSAIAIGGFDKDIDGNVLGTDLAVFRAAGALVAEDRGADLYDAAAFTAAFSETKGREIEHDLTYYRNPPALAYVFSGAAGLPQPTAWLLLSAVSLLALVGAFRFVGVPRPRLAAVLAVATLPGLITLRLGQLSFLWALVFGLVYWLLARDRQVEAGLVGAILVLKPQFAVALILWWLMSGLKHRTALLTMAGTGGFASFVAFVMTPGSFSGFREATLGAFHESTFPSGFSIADAALGVSPSLPATFVALLSAGLGVGAIAAVRRRCGDDLPAMFAAAVFAAVWIPSHLLAYDWVLLAVAIGALWAARPSQRPQWILVGALLASWAFVAWAIALIADSLVGARLELAAVGLVVIAWWSFRTLLTEQATAEVATSRTLPVNV
jgi:hypothetical protein